MGIEPVERGLSLKRRKPPHDVVNHGSGRSGTPSASVIRGRLEDGGTAGRMPALQVRRFGRFCFYDILPLPISTGNTGISSGNTGISSGNTGMGTGNTGISTGIAGISAGYRGTSAAESADGGLIWRR
jgi:hypothetical protein